MPTKPNVTDACPAVMQHISDTVGTDPNDWSKWPGGWPDEIGTALVDAIYSARAVYKSKYGHGIYPLVVSWQAEKTDATSSLRTLSKEISTKGPTSWAHHFGNSQNSPGRPTDAPGGPTKAAAVLQAANALTSAGVETSADISADNIDEVKQVLGRVPGIGFATTNYFLMLLGLPGVKPDRMIHRFLSVATSQKWSDRDAETLIELAAARLEVEPQVLEHAIWSRESALAAG